MPTFVQEPTMTKDVKGLRAWTKPEVKRLGEIKDVANNQTPLAQASNSKS